MRTSQSRTAAAITALAAGAIAAYVLKPTQNGPTSATASRQPPAEVRTQVIRRTVHVVRHERPPRPRSGGAQAAIAAGGGARLARTGSSGSHALGATSVAPGARTRTSGASGGGAAASVPVRTHTSGAGASAGGSVPVRTRSSGAAAGSPRGAVRTRTSGGRTDDGGSND